MYSLSFARQLLHLLSRQELAQLVVGERERMRTREVSPQIVQAPKALGTGVVGVAQRRTPWALQNTRNRPLAPNQFPHMRQLSCLRRLHGRCCWFLGVRLCHVLF